MITTKELVSGYDGIGRSGKGFKSPEDSELSSLSEIFVRRVSGKHNKNVTFGLVGEMGSGKSMVLVELARRIAEKLAEVLGGSPEDYFTFDNVAIINDDSISEKLHNLKPYNVYILDDFAVSMDSRNFMKEQNKDFNHILSTCRVTNNCILMSMPDSFMVDKIPRTISAYWGEVSESRHGQGLTFIKVFRMRRKFRQGKTLYYYITKGNAKIVRFYSPLPPEDIREQYEEVRRVEGEKVKERAKQNKDTRANGSSKREQKFNAFVEEHGQQIADIRYNNPDMKQYALAQKFGCSPNFIGKVCQHLNVPFS